MMALYKISWIPVVHREDPFNVIGIISRNDVLKARRKHLEHESLYQNYINISLMKEKKNVNR
jgi:predicted transcriptional regulator